MCDDDSRVVEEAQPSGGKMWNLSIKLKKGLDSPNAKKIVQMIKEKKYVNSYYFVKSLKTEESDFCSSCRVRITRLFS